MSVSTSRPTSARPTGGDVRRQQAALAASVAVALMLGNVVVGLLGPTDDHTTGLGLLSEVTAGLAFLCGALCLGLLVPVNGWRRVLWLLAPAGLTISGLTMLGVPVIGSEPAEWLFVVAVLPTFVGLVAAGILGTSRTWTWPTGAGLALFLPVMFLLPLNSFVMAAVWAAVAVESKRYDVV